MITDEEIAHALDVADVDGRCLVLERTRPRCSAAVVRAARWEACTSWPDAFLVRTVAVEGGHVEWTGPLNDHGTPLLKVGRVAETAYRYAFRVHHGREAEGKTMPACGYPRCVAGGHLEDRILREARVEAERERAARERLEASVASSPPAWATWHQGVDLVAVERVKAGTHPLPELTEEEQRYATVVMTRAEISASVIAERLGVTDRTVTRWRAEAGLSDECP